MGSLAAGVLATLLVVGGCWLSLMPGLPGALLVFLGAVVTAAAGLAEVRPGVLVAMACFGGAATLTALAAAGRARLPARHLGGAALAVLLLGTLVGLGLGGPTGAATGLLAAGLTLHLAATVPASGGFGPSIRLASAVLVQLAASGLILALLLFHLG